MPPVRNHAVCSRWGAGHTDVPDTEPALRTCDSFRASWFGSVTSGQWPVASDQWGEEKGSGEEKGKKREEKGSGVVSLGRFAA